MALSTSSTSRLLLGFEAAAGGFRKPQPRALPANGRAVPVAQRGVVRYVRASRTCTCQSGHQRDIKGTSKGHQSKLNGHQRDINGTSKGHRTGHRTDMYGHVRTCSGHVADMYRHNETVKTDKKRWYCSYITCKCKRTPKHSAPWPLRPLAPPTRPLEPLVPRVLPARPRPPRCLGTGVVRASYRHRTGHRTGT